MFSCFFVCSLLIGVLVTIGLFFEFDDITKEYSISENEQLIAVGWSNPSDNNNTRDFTTHIKYRKRIFPGIYCEKEIFRIDSDEFNPDRTEKLDYKGYIEIPFKEYYERIKDEDFSNCGKNLPFVQEYSEYNGWYFD